MVACPKCVVNNTLDSTYCKKCGAVLPVAVIEEEQAKLKEIVTKGMDSYQNGNLEESMAIADHAILTNPSYAEAYALKGLIHERKAEYAEALDAYETVVALNPDSTIDMIKLNQLRNAFALRQAEPKTDRKGAALMGLAAALLVISVGGVAYGVIQSSHETKQNQASNMPAQGSLANVGNPLNQNSNPQPQNTPVDGNTPNPGNHEPGDVGALGGSDNNPPIESGPKLTTRSHRTGLSGTVEDDGFDPALVNTTPRGPINKNLPPANSDQNPPKQPHGKEPEDPKPDQKGGSGGGVTAVADTTPSGTYEFEVSKKGNGDGSPARNNTGRVYQQQARDQARSGKTSQARDSYQKAIDAYEKEISSGKGDKDAAQAGMNSCKQALKNLKD